jgi:hypothetical protein
MARLKKLLCPLQRMNLCIKCLKFCKEGSMLFCEKNVALRGGEGISQYYVNPSTIKVDA